MSQPWFRVKRYGYGTGLPIAWQGWASLVVFVGALVAIRVFVAQLLLRIALSIVLIGGYVLLVRAKTDQPWRWRWGNEP